MILYYIKKIRPWHSQTNLSISVFDSKCRLLYLRDRKIIIHINKIHGISLYYLISQLLDSIGIAVYIFAELHYSQTACTFYFLYELFGTFTELHYSQTEEVFDKRVAEFGTFTELLYSQTTSGTYCHISMFGTFTELHYSQTPNPKYESKVPKIVQSPPSVIL